jgi:hypothetical protein
MGKSEHTGRIAALMAVVALTHAWVIPSTLSPAPDTLAFIRIAQRFQNDPLSTVIRQEQHHPLYPMLVACVESALGGLAGCHGPECWRVAAQLTASLGAALLVVPIYAFAVELLGSRAAWWGVLIFVLLPTPNRITADGLSDGIHLLGFTTGLWAAARAFNGGRVGWFAIAGIATGLGFWTRPEALLLPVAVLILMVAQCCLGTQRLFSKASVLGVFGLIVGVVLVILPYVILKGGRLTDKGVVRLVVTLPHIVKNWQAKPAASHHAIDAESVAVSSDVPAGGASNASVGQPRRTYASAVAAITNVFLDSTHYLTAFLALWALVVPWAPRSAKPAAYLLAILAALVVPALVRLYLLTGYVASRHMLLLVVAICPWAGSGLVLWLERGVWLAGELARRLGQTHSEKWIRASVPTAVVAVLALACLPKMLQPLHLSRWGHRQAAAWLAEHCPPDATLLDHHGVSAFYADRRAYNHQELAIARQDPSLQYVVMESQDLARSEPLYRQVRQFVRTLGAPVATFPLFEDGTEHELFVFAHHQPRLAIGELEPTADRSGMVERR